MEKKSMDNMISGVVKNLEIKNGLVRNDQHLVQEQLATLKSKATTSVVISLLEQQVESLLKYMKNVDVEKGHIPFLPVIPAIYSTIFDQIKMINLHGTPGGSFLDASAIYDLMDTLPDPYWIIDVSIGDDNKGQVPDEIDYKGRHPVNCVEALSLCLHTDVLKLHAIDVAGSRIKDDNRIPHLYDTATRVEMGYSYKEAHSHWGSPSYKQRWQKENKNV
jgi:hypothetical protein